MPEGAKTEAPKGLGERNMSLYNVRNYLLRFRRISEVIVWCKKTRISAVPRKIGVHVCNVLPTGLVKVDMHHDVPKFH